MQEGACTVYVCTWIAILYIFRPPVYTLTICMLVFCFFCNTACAQSVCTPVSCETRVYLSSSTASKRDPPYACRGEELVFHCAVVNGASLQWASEPDIPCNRSLGYTMGDDEGEIRTRGPYQSRLTSVTRNSPNLQLSSVLTFIPSASVDNVTVVCGDQLSLCSSTKEESTINIAGECTCNMQKVNYTPRCESM